MAGTSFMITIVLFVTIVGLNSETSTWDGYDVIREISPTNFTQSLTRIVAGIKTVDRTIKLKNALTHEIISIDHSITTTNNGVATLDRTLEKFYPGGNLKLHDHFFNSSKGDTVITGNNQTIWYQLLRSYSTEQPRSDNPYLPRLRTIEW
ncbi:Protein of unknown function [Cotesia congregata]|uniref:Uncharacterized protein n=1 Tax=Cotesia congregata TaxID=51543 RepID=A0A8J2MTT1_COTCN|nr:Protein of unknown function [Cotesia congregata]